MLRQPNLSEMPLKRGLFFLLSTQVVGSQDKEQLADLEVAK